MAESYKLTADELYYELGSSAMGLTSQKAEENLKKYGRNEIVQGKKKHPVMIFLSQFADFLVIILIIAALVSAVTGDMESFFVIVAVITMNAIIGTVQTIKAEKSLDELKKLNSPNAKVMRNGEKMVIPSEEVAVGDIVLLEAGDCIPADGRITESASLQTNESALTGESLNIDKTVNVISDNVPLGDRKNMVYSGSFVTYGRGSYIVTETGMKTEVGKIASMIQNADERKTPLQNTLDNFGKKLSIAILVICGLVFGLSMLRAEEINFNTVMEALMFAIALAVAAIPEALSSIVTIVLSFGTQKMSKENAIMRKLQAVEGLGSVSVICSDKTGTLTQNKMTVRRIVCDGHRIVDTSVDVSNQHEKELIIASVLCNDSSCRDGVDIGDPTETALIHFARTVGLSDDEIRENYERISEIPFDSDRKLMSTLNAVGGKHIMYTKGAADVLIDRMHVTESEKNGIYHQIEHMSKKGLRILCFACKEFNGDEITTDDEDGLEYMGLIAMMDPPREESKQAVEECKSAGIKPVMITGDHLITASAIAKEIGILDSFDEAVEGSVLDNYTDEELTEFVADKSVYARVTPEHKIRIVKAWQSRNNIVAMTGDGVNDAPALKQADVGVAMGITGTEVSKDAAAMVLADDNFATIVKAVKNGRNLYDNIKKAILFLLSGNLAGIIAVLFNSVAGLPAPFAAIHLLFINLLTDSLPAIALGLEPHSDSVMKKKPRPANESIMTKPFLFGVTYGGIIIAIFTIAAYLIGYNVPMADSANAAASWGGNNSCGMTMAFATLCMSRLFHGFSSKADEPVLFTDKMLNNKWGLMAFAAGMIMLNAVLLVPGLHKLFSISPDLHGAEVLTIYALSIGSMLAIQLFKYIMVKTRR